MEGIYQRAFQSRLVLEELPCRGVGCHAAGCLKWIGMLRLTLQTQVRVCFSLQPVIVVLKSIHNASSTPSHLTASDYSIINIYKSCSKTILLSRVKTFHVAMVIKVNYATASKALNLIPNTIPTWYVMSNIKSLSRAKIDF